MKTLTLVLTTFSLLSLSSCMKESTCTCKDSAGKVAAVNTKKSNSKESIKQFEDECKKSYHTESTNGVVTAQIPCEVTN